MLNKIFLTIITASLALSLFDLASTQQAIELLSTNPQKYFITLIKISIGQKILAPFVTIFNTKIPSFDTLDLIPIILSLIIIWIIDKINDLSIKRKIILSLILIPSSILLFKLFAYYLFMNGMATLDYDDIQSLNYLDTLPTSIDTCFLSFCINPLIISLFSLSIVSLIFIKVVFYD